MVCGILLLQAHQLVLHLGADQRIQGRECLVHEQNGRFGSQCAGEAHTLLHPAGKLVRVAVRHGLQAHGFQRLQGLCALFRPAPAGHIESESGVLGHGLVRQQGEGLKNHAHLLTAHGDERFLAHRRDVFAIEQNTPARRLDEAVEHAHQRRLAGSG